MDKSGWGDGPWQDEPDKVQWPDGFTGMPCIILRNRMGAWCGYVGVTKSHPLYEVGYDDAHDRNEDIEVHGGLTFSSHCQRSLPEAEGACHVPGEGEDDDVWWFGFDCAHAFDLMPAVPSRAGSPYPPSRDVYRDMDYVKAEVANLAGALGEMS